MDTSLRSLLAPVRRTLAHPRLPSALALAWVALVFTAFTPGVLSVDSVVQLRQAEAGELSNWHPPLVTLWYGAFFRLTGSTWPALLLQLLGLGLGVASLVRQASADRRALALGLALTLLCLPPTWALGVSVWKDILLAVALLWAVILLVRGRPWPVLGLALVAALVRHNGIFAAVPLVFAALGLVPVLARSLPRRLAASIVALGVMAAAPKLLERALHVRDQAPLPSLLLYDIVGTHVHAGAPLPEDSLLARYLRVSELGSYYTPLAVNPLLWGGPELPRFPVEQFPVVGGALRAEWLRAIRMHPAGYVQHRWASFCGLMGSYGIPYTFQEVSEPNDWGLAAPRQGLIPRAARWLMLWTREWVVYRGWLWVGLSALMSVVGLVLARRKPVVFWAASSGLTYAAGYLLIGLASDFRYLYWTVIATFAAALLALRPEAGRGVAAFPRDTPAAGPPGAPELDARAGWQARVG